MGRLVLSRIARESVTIGKPGDVLTAPIIVSVADFNGAFETVRLGFEAQPNINIVRTELIAPDTTFGIPTPYLGNEEKPPTAPLNQEANG